MKIIVWGAFGVLALAWTAGAFITAEILQWGAGFIASGAAVDLGTAAAQWPAPAWLAIWLDPAAVESVRMAAISALQALRGALPWLGSAVGWLVPLAWIVWGVGMASLLGLAGVAHWLLGRDGRAGAALGALMRNTSARG